VKTKVLAWVAAGWLGAAPAAAQGGDQSVAWSDEWPRFRDWEYVTMPLSFVPALARLLPHHSTTWTDGVGLVGDEWVRDTVALPNGNTRRVVLHTGDFAFYSLALYPVVDAAIVAWALDSPDAGGQTTPVERGTGSPAGWGSASRRSRQPRGSSARCTGSATCWWAR
jgi:hypothetical protein